MLAPHRKENGGPLEVEHVTYAEGRGNLIIRYPGTGSETDVLSFVGSHLDVVPANPEAWDVDPFSLTVDGDKLFGRGTTDCLGHVALMTTLFSQLAEIKPELKTSLTCVFIASEEASGPGIGVDGLVAEGRLDACKPGPVVWVDCADSQPCIGTAGAITWHLTANGHRFHSGLPHKGINAIELAMEATARIQQKFYESFPACDKEAEYKFITPSTMKPTQVKCAPGGLNQIPPEATVSGDVCLTPFYEVSALKACVEAEVAAMNEDIEALPTRGVRCGDGAVAVDGVRHLRQRRQRLRETRVVQADRLAVVVHAELVERLAVALGEAAPLELRDELLETIRAHAQELALVLVVAILALGGQGDGIDRLDQVPPEGGRARRRRLGGEAHRGGHRGPRRATPERGAGRTRARDWRRPRRRGRT